MHHSMDWNRASTKEALQRARMNHKSTFCVIVAKRGIQYCACSDNGNEFVDDI